MKLLRWGNPGEEKPGLLGDDGVLRDMSRHVEDWAHTALAPESLEAIRSIELDGLPAVSSDTRLGPCVAGTRNFVCIGLNYSDHARETGAEPPSEPVIFGKSVSSIIGPDDDLVLPPGSRKTDWEVELGVVIGTEAKEVSLNHAMDHVAGYCVVNDYSERAFQLEGTGQWIKGKSYDGFGPIGPWLVTSDEVQDPQDLAMWLEVNGKRFQSGTSANMIFAVPDLVSYVSRYIRLQPGDIISTGTPPGVGLGQTPPVYLKPGDRVELGIEGLGRQRQRILSSH